MKIIECPRDAMQGMYDFIPTKDKARYINALLKVGFDTIDFGSFVNPRAIPQMADTKELIKLLDLSSTSSKLLAIVGNLRGAIDACAFEQIQYLGFPFSISDTFQRRNINSDIEGSFRRAESIMNSCVVANKEFVIYISMAFGNPYNDPWDIDIALKWAYKLHEELDVKIISMSDTIGVGTPESIEQVFGELVTELPEVEFGAHLHTTPDSWCEKVAAATKGGCKRFDGAIKGYGGCPMAKDDLVGNMPTENLIYYFEKQGIELGLNKEAFLEATTIAGQIFPAV